MSGALNARKGPGPRLGEKARYPANIVSCTQILQRCPNHNATLVPDRRKQSATSTQNTPRIHGTRRLMRFIECSDSHDEVSHWRCRAQRFDNACVLPAVPIRHWISSLPWGVRALCGYDKERTRDPVRHPRQIVRNFYHHPKFLTSKRALIAS